MVHCYPGKIEPLTSVCALWNWRSGKALVVNMTQSQGNLKVSSLLDVGQMDARS